MNVWIFSRPAMRTSTNFLLTAIAVADILVILERSCRPTVYFATSTINDFVNTCTAMYNGMHTVEYTGLLMSEWLSVALAIWRYIAVTRPLKAKEWCSTSRAKVVTAVVVVLSLTFSLPCLYFVSYFKAIFRGSTIYLLTPRAVNGRQFGVEHQSYVATMVTAIVLPIVILVILTLELIRNTLNGYRRRSKLGVCLLREEVTKNRTTTMLIVVLVIFIVTNIPVVVLNISFLIPDFRIKFSITAYTNFFRVMMLCGSGMNFFVYLCMSSNYKRTFNNAIAKIKRKPEQQATLEIYTTESV